MEMESCVPPGFRFHPTEEELVGYYLKRKINALKIDLDVIVDVDLYKIEPWDIQDLCKLGYDEQNEWYFFSHKDKKYPTGTRTNRATVAGFWKATGRDKAVLSKNRIIGMRKTLVFYKGRAPNGRKSDWIMHEYRLQTSEHAPPQEEGWVVCRAFRKPSPSHLQRPPFEAWNQHYYARPHSSTDFTEAKAIIDPNSHAPSFNNGLASAHNQDHNTLLSTHNFSHEALPQLDSPSSASASFTANEGAFMRNDVVKTDYSNEMSEWQNLDCFLTTQLLNPALFANSNAVASASIPPCDYDEQRALNSHFHGCFPEL